MLGNHKLSPLSSPEFGVKVFCLVFMCDNWRIAKNLLVCWRSLIDISLRTTILLPCFSDIFKKKEREANIFLRNRQNKIKSFYFSFYEKNSLYFPIRIELSCLWGWSLVESCFVCTCFVIVMHKCPIFFFKNWTRLNGK